MAAGYGCILAFAERRRARSGAHGYAGDDPELHRIMSELRAESEQFHRAMPERMRKQHYAMSRQQLAANRT